MSGSNGGLTTRDREEIEAIAADFERMGYGPRDALAAAVSYFIARRDLGRLLRRERRRLAELHDDDDE